MVTIGMNYETRPGRGAEFEQVFDGVLGLMKDMPGHDQTHLFRAVKNSNLYLVVSQWYDRAAFDAFIQSERFRKVADWGKREILASQPKHEVYGDPQPAAAPAGCPMHAK